MKVVSLVVGFLLTMGCVEAPPQDDTRGEVVVPETRSIEMTMVAEATPEEVFALWSTVEGTAKFFAPASRIGAVVGDPYEIIFNPEGDPEGANHGTKGAAIRSLEAGRSISFGWTFPPFGPAFNTMPFPTWVEITVEPFAEDAERTLVHFAHRGFPVDASWDEVYRIFRDGNWPLVLNRLLVYCRDGVSPEWGVADGEHLDRFLLKTKTVKAPVADVWNAWTTKDGLEAFFCEQANIELRPGGPYEILFSLEAPEGDRGCEGCQVVAFEPGRWLTFTWNSPPSIPEVRHEQTNVIVEFEAVDGGTEVRLLAIGWGGGDAWIASHQYFDRAWDAVLGWLEARFQPADEAPEVHQDRE